MNAPPSLILIISGTKRWSCYNRKTNWIFYVTKLICNTLIHTIGLLLFVLLHSLWQSVDVICSAFVRFNREGSRRIWFTKNHVHCPWTKRKNLQAWICCSRIIRKWMLPRLSMFYVSLLMTTYINYIVLSFNLTSLSLRLLAIIENETDRDPLITFPRSIQLYSFPFPINDGVNAIWTFTIVCIRRLFFSLFSFALENNIVRVVIH